MAAEEERRYGILYIYMIEEKAYRVSHDSGRGSAVEFAASPQISPTRLRHSPASFA